MVGKSTSLLSMFAIHGDRGYAISIGPLLKAAGINDQEVYGIVDIIKEDGFYRRMYKGKPFYIRKKGIDMMMSYREDHGDDLFSQKIMDALDKGDVPFIPLGNIY